MYRTDLCISDDEEVTSVEDLDTDFNVISYEKYNELFMNNVTDNIFENVLYGADLEGCISKMNDMYEYTEFITYISSLYKKFNVTPCMSFLLATKAIDGFRGITKDHEVSRNEFLSFLKLFTSNEFVFDMFSENSKMYGISRVELIFLLIEFFEMNSQTYEKSVSKENIFEILGGCYSEVEDLKVTEDCDIPLTLDEQVYLIKEGLLPIPVKLLYAYAELLNKELITEDMLGDDLIHDMVQVETYESMCKIISAFVCSI